MNRLRHGRWYTLTISDTYLVILRAHNGFPGELPWQLLEDCSCLPGFCRCGDRPDGFVHLSVNKAGGFVQDDSIETYDTDRGIVIERSALTVEHLVPADALAHVAWSMNGETRVPCSRCGARTALFHHPLCHTAWGVPLFPTLRSFEWQREIADASPIYEWSAVLKHAA